MSGPGTLSRHCGMRGRCHNQCLNHCTKHLPVLHSRYCPHCALISSHSPLTPSLLMPIFVFGQPPTVLYRKAKWIQSHALKSCVSLSDCHGNIWGSWRAKFSGSFLNTYSGDCPEAISNRSSRSFQKLLSIELALF